MKYLLFTCCVIFTFACNKGYDKQLQLGADQYCEAHKISEQLERDPDNKVLQEQGQTTLRMIELHKDLPGDPDQFEKD
jgi:hypothetical protein